MLDQGKRQTTQGKVWPPHFTGDAYEEICPEQESISRLQME